MNVSKTISTVGVGAAIVAGSMFAVNAAGAHNIGSGDGNKSERISALAEKLGVDEASVESAFSELKEEKQAERKAKHAKHIASLVADGTLTQEQADALSAKREELKAAKETLNDQDLSRAEIKEQMESAREEFKAWAEEQGIDLESIRPEGMKKGGKHNHGPRG